MRHSFASAKQSVGPSTPVFDSLEDRRLMSVGPATIANASVNDTVYEAGASKLHAIYYNYQNKTLNYQSFKTDGTSTASQVIDNSGDTGQYLSLAQDSSGVLHAAYYDVKNGDLKYARRATNGTWTVQTVDSKNTTGLYPSIAIDADGRPAIAYYYKNSGDLKFAKFNGSTWNLSVVTTVDDIGRYPSLALNPDTNKLGIGFEDTTKGTFLYAENGGLGSTKWAITTIDSTTQGGGGYISLNYNNGMPSMSYYDAFNSNLKYAERSSRGKWSNTTVASSGSQGLYTDLAYTFDTDQPAIVYYNKTADSVVLTYRKPDGSWFFDTRATGGGRNVSAADAPSLNGQVPDLFLIFTNSATDNLNVGTY